MCRPMTASRHKGIAPSKTMATRRRRRHAEYAVVTALISAAPSVVGAAQLPVTTCLRSDWAHPAASEPMRQVTADMQNGTYRSESSEPGTVLTVLIRPAPSGEITPTPPQIPAPTVKPIAPSVAPPPPRAEQPLSPPPQQERPAPQQERPAPQQEGPAPQQEGPAPQQEGPAPQQEGPPPQQEGPAPQQEVPPSPPPPRGHVQLAP
jgi:hypothetical protein